MILPHHNSFVVRGTPRFVKLIGALAFGCASSLGAAVEKAAVKTDADYFGVQPPREHAEVFAPGVVSRPERFEARIAFSPDNQQCYLTETDATFSHPKLLVAHRTAQGWSNFAAVPFAAKFKFCHEPFVSGDNQRVFFTADGDDAVATDRRDFWKVEWDGKAWSEPMRLAAPINSDAVEFFYNESANGTVVFASNRTGGQGDFDLYRIEKSLEGAIHAVAFEAPVNTPGPEFDPCISPDGRFMIFGTALGRSGVTGLGSSGRCCGWGTTTRANDGIYTCADLTTSFIA